MNHIIKNIKSKATYGYSLLLIIFTFIPVDFVFAQLKNPIKGASNFQQLIGLIINAILGLTGSIALVMFVYGGLMWMLSGGNQDRVKKGRDTFVWAILGLVVIFTSYTVVNFIFTTLTKR